jgi:hypothetical protein
MWRLKPTPPTSTACPPHARAQTDAFRQHLENFLLFQSSPARGSGCNTQHASSPMPSLSCFNPHPPVGAGATIYTHGNDVCWCEFSGLFGTVSCEFNSRLFAYLAISVPHLGTRESISEATQPTVHRSRHTGRLCEVHSLCRVAHRAHGSGRRGVHHQSRLFGQSDLSGDAGAPAAHLPAAVYREPARQRATQGARPQR